MAKPVWMRDLDQDQIGFYLALSYAQAACRAKRRHNFHLDDLGPDAPIEGIEIELVQGYAHVKDYCKRGCGRWIEYDTDRNGVIDWDSAHYGGGGSQYHAKGLGLTAADDRAFWRHLQAEKVSEAVRLRMKKARQATARAETAKVAV